MKFKKKKLKEQERLNKEKISNLKRVKLVWTEDGENIEYKEDPDGDYWIEG